MVLDPAGHIRIAVSDLQRSARFYTAIFGVLGYQWKKEKAWVTRQGFGIWLIQAEHAEPRHLHGTPGLHHLCFPARKTTQVDEVYRLLHHLDGARGHTPPQFYPAYADPGEMYYAVFFFDPDGIKLEVAYHR